MIDNEMAFHIHETAKNKGFWDAEVDANFVLAKLALISSEVSEVLEAYRKQKGSDAIMEEFADIIIRTYDLIEGLAEHGIIESNEMGPVIRKKMGLNTQRERRHGNLI